MELEQQDILGHMLVRFKCQYLRLLATYVPTISMYLLALFSTLTPVYQNI